MCGPAEKPVHYWHQVYGAPTDVNAAVDFSRGNTHASVQIEMIYLLICLVVFGYPLTALFVSFAGVDSTVITVPYRAGVFVLALLILMLAAARRVHGVLDGWLAIFLGLYLVRITHDWNFAGLPGAFEAWRFFVVATLVPAIAIGLSADLRLNANSLTKRLLLVGAVFCALFFLARFAGLSAAATFDTQGGRYEARESLEALNPISLGSTFVTAALAALITVATIRGPGWKLLGITTGVVAVAGMLFAASRGPMLAFIVALAWFAIMRFSRAIFLIPLLLLGTVFLSFDSLAMRRLMDVFDLDINTMSYTMWIRLQIQQSALDDLWENPLFGKHFLDPSWGDGSYPHNIFIEAGMAVGTIGLLALVFIHFRLADAVMRHTNTYYPLISLMLVQYFVAAQTSGTIWGADQYLPVVALALSLAACARRIPPQAAGLSAPR